MHCRLTSPSLAMGSVDKELHRVNMRASVSVDKLNTVAMRRSVSTTSYSLLGDLCGLQLLSVLDICL